MAGVGRPAPVRAGPHCRALVPSRAPPRTQPDARGRMELPDPRDGRARRYPREVLREFSRRRIEVEEAAAAIGDTSVPTRRRLAIETRAAKDYHVDPDELRDDWCRRADLHGLNRDLIERLLRSVQTSVPRTAAVDDEQLGRLLRYDDSTFDRRLVLTLLAHHSVQGATIRELETRADEFLASRHVAPVGVARTRPSSCSRSNNTSSTASRTAVTATTPDATRDRSWRRSRH